jgi:hypothetical protein
MPAARVVLELHHLGSLHRARALAERIAATAGHEEMWADVLADIAEILQQAEAQMLEDLMCELEPQL